MSYASKVLEGSFTETGSSEAICVVALLKESATEFMATAVGVTIAP